MNRREFSTALGGAASAGPLAAQTQTKAKPSSPIRQDWLDRRKEPVLEPAIPIIDPHHHLWDRPGWRYLLDELLDDTNSGHNIVATVYVQARSMYREKGPAELRPVGETEFVNGIAAMSASGVYGKIRACAGIIGHADLTLGSRVEPVLAALVRAATDRFRGIRHITAWDASIPPNPAYPVPAGLLADKSFREGFAVLSRLGLSFDAHLNHPQIGELAALADAFPNSRIVLNHIGTPLRTGAYSVKRKEVFPAWAAAIRVLAARPNVFIKVGGFGMARMGFGFQEHADPPSSETIASAARTWVETCIEAFGTSRSMFESNFPVDKVSFSYQVFWNACKILAKGSSSKEKADLFAGTAARFYRLDDFQ